MPPKRAAQSISSEEVKNKKPKLATKQALSVKESKPSQSGQGLVSSTQSLMKAELLWLALENGEEDKALSLVNSGADLSIRKAVDRRTVLHEVMRSHEIKDNAKREELAKLMLDLGADLNARDSKDYSVLHDALARDHCSVSLAEQLLHRGAEVTVNQRTDLNDIFWVVSKKPELLIRLIEHQVPNEEVRNQRGAMAINYIILKGNKFTGALQAVTKILDLGVPANAHDPFAVQGSENQTRSLLCTALLFRNENIAKLLLDYGADPHEKDERGNTPLILAAAFKGYTHMSRWLIEKGANIHDRNDCCPIHNACSHESWKNIHLLLSLGANLNCTDYQNRTPFGCMKMKGRSKLNEAHCSVIKYLALNIAKGETMSDKDMAKINQFDWSKNYYQKCDEELERMKKEMVYHDVSYFSILSRNMKSMVQLMKNQNFIKIFNYDEKNRANMFPIYSYMILHSFELSEKRLEFLRQEKKQLHEALEDFMPDHIIELITYYYCFEKLERCKYDYYISLHANLKNTKADKAKIL